MTTEVFAEQHLPKVAVVHDWLMVNAGAERVLQHILEIYPGADLFVVCDFLKEGDREILGGRVPRTTLIQRLPFARTRHRAYLPLMPLAIEQLDLSSYDIVLSSSHAVAKGVLVGPDQLHVSYVHSPLRYAWDLQHQYLHRSGVGRGLRGWVARLLLHRIRMWDSRTANGVDVFVANSAYIARRITKVYRRDSVVIPPPVDVTGFSICEDKESFYLVASRLVPYKRVDAIVQAFVDMPNRHLVVIGDGPEFSNVERLAKGKLNIELLGYQPTSMLRDYMQRARAFVFAAEEDFGIAPVEAQACGTPVIAFGKGGALETVRPLGAQRPSGLFFDAQTPSSIIAAVERFEREGGVIRPQDCRANAEQFSSGCFRERLSSLVSREWAAFSSRTG